MEMMIVLLIVSVVAAASAPMINKKLVGVASEKSPWVWSGTGQSIAYNLNGSDGRTATIGAVDYSATENKPRLFIQSPSANNPQIALRSSTEAPLRISWHDNTISMSTINKGKNNSNSVIIGKGISTEGNSSSGSIVAVGAGIDQLGAGATVLGYKAGAANYGTAVGNSAHSKEGGVALGSGSNTQTLSSIAIGKATVSNESGGSSSIAIGAGSFAKGSSSIALGSTASASNHYSIAIGSNKTTAYGQKSIAIGSDEASATAQYSIAIGPGAQVGKNGTGSMSIAMGYSAIAGNASEAKEAIAIGSFSTAGNYYRSYGAVAIGTSASAPYNNSVAIGYDAHGGGQNSVTIGPNAQTLNQDEVTIGYNTYNTGYNGIAIGRDAFCGYANSAAIGYNARTLGSNQMVLGNANTTVYIPGKLIVNDSVMLGLKGSSRVYLNASDGQGLGMARVGSDDNRLTSTEFRSNGRDTTYEDALKQLNTHSDRRLKNVGKAFSEGLEQIKKLEVFNYTFKKDPNKTPRVGVMAQDLQKIFPNAVVKGEDGFLRIRMEDMFYALINAVKELDAKIEALKNNEIKLLKDKVSALEKENDALEKRIEALEKKIK